MIEGTFPSHRLRQARQALGALRDLIAGKSMHAAAENGVRPDFSYQPVPSNPGPLQPEDRLVFMHIEKTAGSTAHYVLAQNFREEEICPYRFGGLNYFHPHDLAGYRYFALHSHLRSLRSIPPPTKFLTFLREPVARLLSHYHYWASLNDRVVEDEGLVHVRFVKTQKLKELLTPASLSVLPEFWNLTTHRIAGDLFLAPSGRAWRSEDELVDVALGNLANFATLGIAEYPDLSFQCMADDLAIPNRYDGARLNVTADNSEQEPDRFDPIGPVALDDETLESLDRATRLDRVLYQAGVSRFRDRMRAGAALNGWIHPHLRTERLNEGEIVIGDDGDGTILYGPYCTLPAGRYCATLWIRADMPAHANKPWSLAIDVCSEMSQVHAWRGLEEVELADRWFEPVDIEFELPSVTNNVEIRLHATGLPALAVKRSIGIRLL